MKRKLIEKAPFILALNRYHSECVVTALVGWRLGPVLGTLLHENHRTGRKTARKKKVQRKIVSYKV